MHQHSDSHLLAPYKCTSVCMYAPRGIPGAVISWWVPGTQPCHCFSNTDCRLSCWQSCAWPRLDPEGWKITHMDQTARNITLSKGPHDKVVINRIVRPPLPIPHPKSPELSPWERSTSFASDFCQIKIKGQTWVFGHQQLSWHPGGRLQAQEFGSFLLRKLDCWVPGREDSWCKMPGSQLLS